MESKSIPNAQALSRSRSTRHRLIRGFDLLVLTSVTAVLLGWASGADAQGLPFTEDFSTTVLRDDAATTADWDTAGGVLRLPLATSAGPIKTLADPFTTSVASAVDASVAISTRVVVLADLNGDGLDDLVFGNDGPDSVYFNAGGGAFVAGSPIPDGFLGGNTRSIAVTDFNGDGHLDVVFAQFGANQPTRLHFNNGSGGPQVFTTGDFVDLGPASLNGDSLATGDVDGDGDTDIALGIRGGYVQLFLNDGFGNFSDPVDIVDSGRPAFGYHARSVALADLDNDGLPELIAGLEFDGIRVFRNELGDFSTFPTQGTAAVTKLGAPDSIAIGDLNGDGDLDLVVGNDGTDFDLDGDGNPDPGLPNQVYFNTGIVTGFFDTPVEFESDLASTTSVALGDVDRDGDLDIVTGDVASIVAGDINRLYVNDGSGTFPTNGTAITAESRVTKSLVIGDVDRDGRLDLAIANDPDTSIAGSAINQVVLNTGSNTATDSDQLFATARSTNVLGASTIPSGGLILSTTDSNPITHSIFEYWLSDDGGLTWISAQPGKSVSFGSPAGVDLRWRVEMRSPSPAAFWRPEISSITLAANEGPFFLSSPVETADEDSLYSYAISANDPDGEAIEISAPTIPAWLTLVDNGDGTGTLEGTPTNDNVGTAGNDVNIRISDSGGLTANQSFTITVANTNDAPTVVSPTGDQTYAEDETVSLDAAAAFADEDVGDVLTYSASGLPPSLSIDNATGLISGTLAGADVSAGPDYAVTVTAEDSGAETAEDTFTITVVNTNDPPEVIAPTGNQSYDEGETVTLDAGAAFADEDGDTLTFTATGLPAGLDIDATTGVISGTLSDLPADYAVTVTADDGNGGTADDAFTITILDVNEAPTFTSTPPTAATEDAAYAYNVTTSDPNGDAVTITASGLPGWLMLTDNGDGTATLSGTPGSGDVGDATVTLTVSDGELETSDQFTITVTAAPPPPPPPPLPPSSSGGSGSLGVPALLMLLMAAALRRRLPAALCSR